MNDLYEKFQDEKNPQIYFGTLITYMENGETKKMIVDGQQRITTFLLIISTLEKMIDKSMSAWEEDEDLNFEKKLPYQEYVESLEGSEYPIKIEHLDEKDCRDMQNATSGNIIDDEKSKIKKAVSVIEKWTKEKFRWTKEKECKKIDNLIYFMMKKSMMVHIETTERKDAYELFETVNDRGMELSAWDLLKHLFYINFEEDKKYLFQKEWQKETKDLEGIQMNPNNFLKYFFISEFETNILATKNPKPKIVYRAFRNGHGSDKFLNKLQDKKTREAKVEAYWEQMKKAIRLTLNFANVTNPKNHKGEQSETLLWIYTLSKKYVQHIPILLYAAKKLDEKQFEKLLKHLEGIAFVWGLLRAQANKVDDMVPRIIQGIKKHSQSNSDLNNFFEQKIQNELISKEVRHSNFPKRLIEIGTQKSGKIRDWFIKKITFHVEKKMEKDLTLLNFFSSDRNQIQKIETKEEIEKRKINQEVENSERLGNMYYKKFTRITENFLNFEKIKNEKDSFALTKTLFEKNKKIPTFRTFNKWDIKAIEQREKDFMDYANENQFIKIPGICWHYDD